MGEKYLFFTRTRGGFEQIVFAMHEKGMLSSLLSLQQLLPQTVRSDVTSA